MRILGIAGSLRRDSHNTRLLRAAATLLPPDVEFGVWDAYSELPPFNEDEEGVPAAAVVALREAVAAADGLLIATPEYNAGIPGALKNAIDWLSRPYPGNALQGRPVAVIGASTGLFGAVWAQDHVRTSVKHAGADVLDEDLPIGQADETLDADGLPRSEEQRASLQVIVDTLVTRANATANA